MTAVLTMYPAYPLRDTIVGVADLRVSGNIEERLVTYALGSCLGVAVYDPVAHIGGLLHVMLPNGALDPDKMAENPSMFVDSGVPALFKECYKLGARKERMLVKVAGGSHNGQIDEDEKHQIGKRNLLTLRRLLWKNGVMLHAQETGGVQVSRTMWLDIGTGDVTLKVNGAECKL
ncbi:MAG: chemotaxis protein CheD [Gemmatimonas sp.]